MTSEGHLVDVFVSGSLTPARPQVGFSRSNNIFYLLHPFEINSHGTIRVIGPMGEEPTEGGIVRVINTEGPFQEEELDEVVVPLGPKVELDMLVTTPIGVVDNGSPIPFLNTHMGPQS
jgi:hypothetical protein